MFEQRINPQKVKKRNTKLLKRLGIFVPEHLPLIEPATVRSATEIAQRLVLLAVILQLRFGATREFVAKYIGANDLEIFASAEERRILESGCDDLNDQEQIDLYWTIEAIWALAWVGKKHEDLTFNTSVGNSLAQMLPNFKKNEPAQSFIESFSMRSAKDIFVNLDRFYRAHWYARELNLRGQNENNVNLSIVTERRRALEWVANSEIDWDDIELNT